MASYGRAASKDYIYSEDIEKTITNFKWLVFILNVISLLTGLATFSLCLWIRFDLDFWEWVEEIDWYTYWYCMYVIMFAMVFVIINSALGVYGVIQESMGLLLTNMIIHGISMLLEFIGAIVICIYGVEESDVLTKELNEVFLKLIYKWDEDPRASRILRQIFEYTGCCGADGSDDFINAHKPVPPECRDLITGCEYAYGCQQQLAWWLEPWTAALAGICIFLIVVQSVNMWAKSRLRTAFRSF